MNIQNYIFYNVIKGHLRCSISMVESGRRRRRIQKRQFLGETKQTTALWKYMVVPRIYFNTVADISFQS